MKVLSLISVTLAACSSSFVAALGLKQEHVGDLFKTIHHGGHRWPANGVINTGTPTGQNLTLNGGMVAQNLKLQVMRLISVQETFYLAYPHNKKTNIAILYLTDIFGNALVNNRLYVVLSPISTWLL